MAMPATGSLNGSGFCMKDASTSQYDCLVTKLCSLFLYINQCLQGVVSGDASYWQSQWQRLKRMMFEAVVEEPLVILVKLADRLHNMRTVYALAPAKQQAVAEETLAVWCSMAGSLGWHGLKVCLLFWFVGLYMLL
jgi:hypothetical protein